MKKFIMVAVLGLGLAIAASASAATFVYTGGLIKVGSQGSQVSDLQTCMNGLGHSTGIVDGIFGPNTKAGVMSFQASSGVVVDGIIGPVTGPLYTAACADGVTYPEGCTSFEGYSSTTGESCAESEEGDLPEGCTSTEGYSPITGEKCDSEGSDDPIWEESEDEGQLVSFETDAPEESTVDENEEKGILNISFEADDADQLITRVDVDFQAADSTESDKPWDYMDKVSILLDGEEIASTDADSSSDWDKTDATPDIYSIRFAGLESLVTKDQEVQLEVVISVKSDVDGSDEGQSWEAEIPTGGIRALSPNGYSETYPTTALNEDFTIAGSDTGTLVWGRDADNPDAKAITLDSAVDTNDVLLAIYNLEADNQDILVEDILIETTITTSGTGDQTSEFIQKFDLKVYDDDDDLVASNSESGDVTVDITAIDHTFNNLDFTIPKGKTYTVEIYADFQPLDGTIVTDTDTIVVSIDASDTVAEQGSGGDEGDTLTPTGDITGETHAVFVDAPEIILVSSTIVKTMACDGACASGEAERAEAIATFTIEAIGADIYVSDASVEDADETDATYGSGPSYFLDEGAGTEPTAVGLFDTVDADAATNAGWIVYKGQTKTFTHSVTITAAADGYQSVGYSSIEWSLTDVADGNAATEDYTYSMQPDWESPSIYLEMTA